MSTFLQNWMRARAMSAPRGGEAYIQFADPAVEAICVANWSSDGIGLTMQDAAAVTNNQFGTTFQGNTQITSFDELQYFTGLTGIVGDAFSGCSALESITFPATITTLGYHCCQNCTSLAEVTILSTTLSANRANFAGCTSLSKVHIPSLATYLGYSFNANTDGGLLYASTAPSRGLYVDGTLLQQLVIPSGTSAIPNNAFCNINEFTSLSLPSSLQIIGTFAFYKCNFAEAVSIILPNSLTTVNSGAFNTTNLEIYVNGLPLVTTIEGETFRGSGLKELILSAVTSYGSHVTYDSPVTKIDLPATLATIGEGFGRRSRSLETLICRATTVPTTSSSNFLGSTPNTLKIYVPYSSDHSVLAAYQADAVWGTKSSQIYELNPDGTIPNS